MASSSSVTAVIDLRQAPKMKIPIPVGMGQGEKATAVFSMTSEGDELTLIGTYDQFLNWAAELGQRMMSWPIVSGQPEWLGDDAKMATMEANSGEGS